MKALACPHFLSSALSASTGFRLFLACGLLALSPSAQAVVIPFENLQLSNTAGSAPDSRLVGSPGTLTGALTAIQADFVLNAETGLTWASDLAVFITNHGSVDLAANGGTGLLQLGGFNNAYGATNRLNWGIGDSEVPGTPVQTTINLSAAQQIVFNGDANDPAVFLAHLYNANTFGDWTGQITLVGLSVVPEPATYALFLGAIVGLVALRRRRRVG